MKAAVFFAAFAACVTLRGAERDPLESYFARWRDQEGSAKPADQPPAVDPKRIINESSSFLKEREPEMTGEEYAVYQKMTGILAGNPQLAIKFLEGMVNEKQPPSPAFDFILGNGYYAAGQMDKAEAHYRSGLKRYPTFLRAWVNLGVLYYGTDRFADAVPCFTEAVNLGDREATTLGLLGYSLEKTGNLVVAELAYMQALESAPNNVDWKLGLLRIYIGGKQYARAETLARALIKEHPEDARNWLAYANILLAEQQKSAASAVLELAATHGVAGPDELTLLGDLYAEQHLMAEALATYGKLTAAAPVAGNGRLLHLAHALTIDGQLDEAGKALAALSTPGSDAETIAIRQTRAEWLIARKRWSAAREEIEAALRVNPMEGHLLLTLGEAFKGEQNIDQAMLAFEAAARVPATTYRASLELANLHLKNREYAKAVERLDKAYRIEKSDAVADLLAQVRALASEPN